MMRPEHPLTFTAIDVETTGLHETAEIIEIGLVHYSNGERTGEWQSFIRPSVPIPPEITDLTGITEADVADAPHWAEIHDVFFEQIKQRRLVAHNHRFDNERITFQCDGVPPDNPWLDTHDLAKLFLPRLTSYKLQSIATALDIADEDHHRALNDADVCAKVFLALAALAQNTDPFTMVEMVDLLREDSTSLFDSGTNVLSDFLHELSQLPFDEEEVSPLFFDEEDDFGFDQPQLSFDQADTFFAGDGALSKEKTDFEHRSQQEDILRIIQEAFRSNRHAIIEAGTGTGKSFAYLVPALLWGYETDQRVIISTNTIALQEQLFKHDIPMLQKTLGYPFHAAIMKGRSNYLCRRRFDQAMRGAMQAPWTEKIFLASLLRWQQDDNGGEKEHLNLNKMEHQMWSRVASTSDTCINTKCPYFRSCYYFNNRKQCENSHLVIVNHSLLLQNTRLDGGILPEYSAVVIDEAHHLEEEATRQFTDTVDLEGIRKTVSGITRATGLLPRILVQCGKEDGLADSLDDIKSIVAKAIEHATDLTSYLPVTIDKACGMPEIANIGDLRLTEKMRNQNWWLDLRRDLEHSAALLQSTLRQLTRLYHRINTAEDMEVAVRELRFTCEELESQLNWLVRFINGDDTQFVYWLTGQKYGWGSNLFLHSAYIDIMPILRDKLFAPTDSVIMTSATLAINQDLSYTAQTYLLEEDDYIGYITPSPFDYQSQSVIAIPTDRPDYSKVSDLAYTKNVITDLKALIPAVDGAMLVLFTSYAMLNKVYFALKQDPALRDYTILGHGQDGSRSAIIAAMQKKPRTVVLGANSFWEGIDVKGDHLRTVVITKLPFSPPTMPIESAKSELMQSKGKNPFAHYSLPKAILRFRQGCGRLIRSKTDQGTIVILDNRVITKAYGKQFIRSLPEQPVLKDSMQTICETLTKRYQQP